MFFEKGLFLVENINQTFLKNKKLFQNLRVSENLLIVTSGEYHAIDFEKDFFDGPSNKFFQSSSSFRNVEKQFVECQIYLPNAEPCNKRHSDHGADDLNNF